LASEILSIGHEIITNKIFYNYNSPNFFSNSFKLSYNYNNHYDNNNKLNNNIPIFQLIFYFENNEIKQNNLTIPGYIQSIIYSLSIKSPQKLQEIVIIHHEKILEIYSNNIDDDSVRQILLSLLTIQTKNEIDISISNSNSNSTEEYDYNQNLKERYFKICIFIIDKLLSKYLSKFFNEAKNSFGKYLNNNNKIEDNNSHDNKNNYIDIDIDIDIDKDKDKGYNNNDNLDNKFEFLNKLYDIKFKIKNIFILVLKFFKFVDLSYHNKIDDILLRIFKLENFKIMAKILFNNNNINDSKVNDPKDNNSYNSNKESFMNLNIAEIYLYEEFLFFFSYFLKICFNKKNCNKEYLMNDFFIDDYEKLYDNQNNISTNSNLNLNTNDNPNDNKDDYKNLKQKDLISESQVQVISQSQEEIEGQILSIGENISGKIDNLYSCSFNLEEKLNDSTKLFLLNFYFENFENFYLLANRIKNFYVKIKEENNNKINRYNINSQFSSSLNFIFNSKKNICSSSYIYFLDFLIVLFDQNKKEFNVKNIIRQNKLPENFFEELIEDLIKYKSNQFIQNKILRVFELLNSDDNFENKNILNDLKNEKILNVSLINKLIGHINFKDYISLERYLNI
jgi:hypothetical protein